MQIPLFLFFFFSGVQVVKRIRDELKRGWGIKRKMILARVRLEMRQAERRIPVSARRRFLWWRQTIWNEMSQKKLQFQIEKNPNKLPVSMEWCQDFPPLLEQQKKWLIGNSKMFDRNLKNPCRSKFSNNNLGLRSVSELSEEKKGGRGGGG